MTPFVPARPTQAKVHSLAGRDVTSAHTGDARVAVIVPCYRDGDYVAEAIASVIEDEPVELVVVDDASPDEHTAEVLRGLEQQGVRVVRRPENGGVGEARTTGLAATNAPYVFPLDSDDLLTPHTLARLADLLEADEGAVVAYGDYEEFGDSAFGRPVPDTIDPYRIAYTNEYPVSALFRREFLEQVGGWASHHETGYEDWDLWMTVAERGRGVYAGAGHVTYRRRLHGVRMLARVKRNHRKMYGRMRRDHQSLFDNISQYRRQSDLSRTRKLLYPIVYGRRPRLPAEAKVKFMLDRIGIWTLRR